MPDALAHAVPAAAPLSLTCQNCGALLSVEPDLRTTVCPYCASPAVVERPPTADRPNPRFAMGFVLHHDAAAAAVKQWIRTRGIFTRSGFDRSRIDEIKGLYVPAYLYSARAHTAYRAEIGENYTTTESYTDSKGHRRTRVVVKTEWRSLSGELTTYVMDVIVTASRGIPNAELERIEPFDLRVLRRYGPEVVSGWIAEEPSMSAEDCLMLARGEAVGKVGAMLTGFMPGDHSRDLRHSTTLDEEEADLVLVPVWALAVRYDQRRPPLRVLVNGQTGEVGGSAPLSWVKITLAVLLALALALALYLWATRAS